MDINVGSYTPKSSTRSDPLTDLANVSSTELEKRHASAMFNNSNAPHQNYQRDRVSFPSVQVFVIGYLCMESLTMIPFSGPFADITNVSAAELNNKRVVVSHNGLHTKVVDNFRSIVLPDQLFAYYFSVNYDVLRANWWCEPASFQIVLR
uniref:Uncharacterized protein n=1 Tax=Leersia perrieri TaxID=77586 RepID=A0A0D9WQU3_9ORYZ